MFFVKDSLRLHSFLARNERKIPLANKQMHIAKKDKMYF